MSNNELWGGETDKAIDNFPVSGERVPRVGRSAGSGGSRPPPRA